MKTCFATVSDVSCGLNVFYFSSFILVLGVELLKVVHNVTAILLGKQGSRYNEVDPCMEILPSSLMAFFYTILMQLFKPARPNLSNI